jgi:hypothetical protein
MGIIRRSQLDEVSPRLEEIGRLFKGSKKQNNRFGKDLEHFRFEPAPRLNDLPSASHGTLFAEVEARWKAMEASTSGWKSLPILLPYRSLEQNLSFRNAVYDGGGRTTRACDGSICTRYQMEVKGKKMIVRGAINCAMGVNDTECPMGCKSEAKLSMIIPSLYPGLIVLTTKSTIDIQTLTANLKGYSRFDLSKIPLRLCRSLRDASYTDPNTGDFRKQQKWLLHIEIDPVFGHAALEAQQEQYRAEITGGARRQLPTTATPLALGVGPVRIGADQIAQMNKLAGLNGYGLDDLKAIVTGFGFTTCTDITMEVWPEIETALSIPNTVAEAVAEVVS